MYKICTCKSKSIFGCDFVNLLHTSVHNCLEYCFGVVTMPRGHLPIGEAERALSRLQAGGSQRQVAAEHGVGQSVIQRLWQKFLDTGSAARRPQSGRPRSTSASNDRELVIMAKRQRFQSAVALNREFQNVNSVRISAQTFRNRLSEAGLNARRPAVRPPLTLRHRRNRLAFARDHVN